MKQILYFTAAWCGPCKMFRPTFEGTLAELGLNAQIIDVDQQRDLATQYQVSSVPTVMVVENGVATKRNSGIMSKQQVKQFINGQER